MKKLLLASVLACLAFNVSAQQEETIVNPTDKGHFIVDGSVYFSTNNSKTENQGFNTEVNSFGLGISPKVSYFIIDRLAIGIEASFAYSDNEYTNNSGGEISSNSTSILIGPSVRYYITKGFFGQASLGFGFSNSKGEGYETKNDSFRYKLGLGYAFFLNEHISIEPILSYQHNKTNFRDSVSDSSNSGLIFGAGFTIYL
jgi:outer membrane protein